MQEVAGRCTDLETTVQQLRKELEEGQQALQAQQAAMSVADS